MGVEQEIKSSAKILKPGNHRCQHIIHVIDNIGTCDCGRKIDYTPAIAELNEKENNHWAFVKEKVEIMPTVRIKYEGYAKNVW
jgi:hypothetical protein